MAREPRRDPADALDVRVAVLLREAEALREMRAHGVAVEVLDDRAALLELRADEVRDRRLAGAGEAGEPEREAAAARPVRTRDARGRRCAHAGARDGDHRSFVPFALSLDIARLVQWRPHSSLSEPAQRPARSSSSGPSGGCRGCSRSNGSPASCSGLYGISLTCDVAPARASRPSRRAVDLPDAVALGPLDLRRVRARRRLLAADAGDPGVVGLRAPDRAARPCGSWQQRSGSRSQRFGPSRRCCSATVMISGRISSRP